MRAVIHLKIESFFAEIEAKRQPDLAGKPVVVAKSSGLGGIVVSASPEAKAFGVTESMTVRHSKRFCPDAVFIPADYALYRSISSGLMDILSGYSPLVEPDSLDRAWIDVTGCTKLFGGPKKIAAEIGSRIGEMGYMASFGIASNKLVAKIASSLITHHSSLVTPGSEREFLAPLPVDLLPGVGEKMARRLFELGVRTAGQLAMIPERMLVRQFGPVGERLYRQSLGIDFSQVQAAWPPDVIIMEHTFPDALSEPAEVEEYLRLAAERLALELRGQNRLAQTVSLELWSWRVTNPQRMGPGLQIPDHRDRPPAPGPQPPSFWRLKRPVNQAGEIFFALWRLLPSAMQPGMEVEGVSIILSDLTIGEGIQLSLLGSSERRRRLDRLVETIHDRFGSSAIIYASALTASGRERVLDRMVA